MRLLEGDIADREVQRESLKGVETVFHLAAAHLSVSADGADFHRVNVEAVKSLVESSREAGLRRFVHCSSVGVFGALKVNPADEDTPCEPEFDYEKTKLEGEGVLLDAFRSEGFPVTILRPAWVYGPGCPRTEKLFRAIRRGRFVIAGSGQGFRHSVYIRDMIAAFESAARRDEALGKVIIIADDEAVTVETLVRHISHMTEAATPRSVPFPLLYAAGALAELVFGLLGRDPPISRRSLRFFSGNTSFRTDRAREILGFEPRYGIQEGLRETAKIMETGGFWSVPLPDPVPNQGT